VLRLLKGLNQYDRGKRDEALWDLGTTILGRNRRLSSQRKGIPSFGLSSPPARPPAGGFSCAHAQMVNKLLIREYCADLQQAQRWGCVMEIGLIAVVLVLVGAVLYFVLRPDFETLGRI
jgi:hypothetical protein